jgi:catechol 2,3-dioxygenase-like lactoylglutathione lyase family enzyme
MNILQIDHVVLTVKDISATVSFYERVLGMQHVIFEERYHALHFGSQKINLHPAGNEYTPHAARPLPGSGDICFVSSGQIEEITAKLRREGIVVEYGPVAQTGARGEMVSVYFRDPDMNLIEVACYPG